MAQMINMMALMIKRKGIAANPNSQWEPTVQNNKEDLKFILP